MLKPVELQTRAQPQQLIAEVQLSKESQLIIDTSSDFNKLKLAINSSIGHSSELSQLRSVTRYEHSIHAAKQAHLIKNANLSGYEIQCLELSLLLHDLGHVLGSHSIDKLFYSKSDSPNIENYGYSPYDFHEYHTVQLAAGDAFKAIFASDKILLANVLAILSYDDKRPMAEKLEHYQFPCAPTLTQEQIELLYTLKDWLDRVSYLELEYQAINFTSEIKEDAQVKINRFRDSVEVHDQKLVIRQNLRPSEYFLMQTGDLPDENPAIDIIRLREGLFEETVYHPLSAAYDEVISRGLKTDFSYAELREQFSKSNVNYRDIFSPEVYRILTQQAVASLTSELVPLVTIDHWLLSHIGLNAFKPTRPGEHSNLIQNVVENKLNSSFAELLIHAELADFLKSRKLYVITSGRKQKTFNYYSIDSTDTIKAQSHTVNSTSKPTTIIALHLSGATSTLIEQLKERIHDIFKKRQWSDVSLPRVFDENIFKRRHTQRKFN